MKQQGVHRGAQKGDHLVTLTVRIPKPDELPQAWLDLLKK
jgi:hypothetical protein